MQNLLFIIIGSLVPLVVLCLFAQDNSLTAQPQMGQPQGGRPQTGETQRGGTSLSKEMEAYTLPSGPITENDIPRIKNIIQEALNKISEYLKNPPGASGRGFMFQAEPEDETEGSDMETIRSGILNFQDWLNRQGCISKASTTYDIETTDKYPENIFITYPGQLPFDIVFNMEGGATRPYRLLIFVSKADFFNFASLVENKTLGGVAVPENWPKDTWSYWEDRH
ncbi:MAG: hypothetical protein JW944_09380 [Deltaproteobacteria bacterium]|nr:hypothetical protein [Deltaproteobacteria bacterium]